MLWMHSYCTKQDKEVVSESFAEPRWLHLEKSRYKYDYRILENAIQSIVESRSGWRDTIMRQPNEDVCRV